MPSMGGLCIRFNADSPIDSIGSFFKHPIFLFIAVGIAVRVILSLLFDVGIDSDCWALIIANLESGNGLYAIEGYFYTPLWGYALSFLSFFQEMFLNIDIMSIRIPEALFIEGLVDWHSANATSIAFNVWYKISLMISDLLIGYLIYWIVKDKTHSVRKATIGFGLWFLCPLTIVLSSVSGMFDTFSVLFLLLCIIMLRKDKLFIGGALFAFAVLMKFFPVFLIFILVAYVLVKHRDDGKRLRSLVSAIAGAGLAVLVLMLPQIINGEISESLIFLTSRAGSGFDVSSSLIDNIVSNAATIIYSIVLLLSAYLGYRLYKADPKNLDDNFFKFVLLNVALIFLYPATPQYLLLTIPFLAIYIATANRKFLLSWTIIFLGGVLFVMSRGFTLMLSFSVFTDFMSIEFVTSMIRGFFEPIYGDISYWNIVNTIAGVIQYVGTFSILLLFLMEKKGNLISQYIQKKT